MACMLKESRFSFPGNEIFLNTEGNTSTVYEKVGFSPIASAGTQLLQADIIYSNLGTPVQFEPGSGLTVASGGTDFSTAFSFVVQGNSYQVTQVDYAAFLISDGGADTVTATIYTDNGGIPGTALYTTSPPDGGLQVGSAIEIMDFVTGGPVLNAGSTYWLSLDAPIDSSVGWAYSDSPTASGDDENFVSGIWTSQGTKTQGAFELDGTVAVPEPVTTSLFISGLASLVFLRKYGSKRGN
jgi:hypothetical protein